MVFWIGSQLFQTACILDIILEAHILGHHQFCATTGISQICFWKGLCQEEGFLK